MVGSCATTYCLDRIIIKTPRIDDEPEITYENINAMRTEADVYRMLGLHVRIANCLYISPLRDMIALEFYPLGHLKHHISIHGQVDRTKWATQMIEAITVLHDRGIRHSDIRLDQWLVDSDGNARLSDFNSAGHDGNRSLAILASAAHGIETASHFMPQDITIDSTYESDIFALGSALYELATGSAPWFGKEAEAIKRCFESDEFPPVSDLSLGYIIDGAWRKRFPSAEEMLRHGRQRCGLA